MVNSFVRAFIAPPHGTGEEKHAIDVCAWLSARQSERRTSIYVRDN